MKKILAFLLLLCAVATAWEIPQGELSLLRQSGQGSSPQEALVQYRQGGFTPLEASKRKFGFTDDTFWFALDFRAPELGEGERYVFTFLFPLLDLMDIYEVKDDGSLRPVAELGDSRAYVASLTFNPAFRFDARPGEEKRFLIRVRSLSVNVSYEITEFDPYLHKSLFDGRALAFYFGAMFIMILYNFFIYLFVRNRNYLYYVLFHLSYMFYLLVFSGIAFAFFWPEHPGINVYSYPIALVFSTLFGLLFMSSFLELGRQTPRLHRGVRWLMRLSASALPLVLVWPGGGATQYALAVAMFSIFVMIGIAVYVYLRFRSPNALYYLGSWGFLLVGGTVSYLTVVWGLQENLVTHYASHIGSFMEVFLLSVGLAAYYNRIQREKNLLEAENRELADISSRDALTGIYNRRYFTERAQVVLTNGEHNALMMLDLDHFKAINDTYGHDAGDAVLRRFAATIGELIRKTDLFARYGGEEFVLLLPKCPPVQARRIADRINELTREIRIDGQPALRLTVSVGCAVTQDSVLEELLKKADDALYDAKNGGRNRFECHEAAL